MKGGSRSHGGMKHSALKPINKAFARVYVLGQLLDVVTIARNSDSARSKSAPVLVSEPAKPERFRPLALAASRLQSGVSDLSR
jgi:hypothetical protein